MGGGANPIRGARGKGRAARHGAHRARGRDAAHIVVCRIRHKHGAAGVNRKGVGVCHAEQRRGSRAVAVARGGARAAAARKHRVAVEEADLFIVFGRVQGAGVHGGPEPKGVSGAAKGNHAGVGGVAPPHLAAVLIAHKNVPKAIDCDANGAANGARGNVGGHHARGRYGAHLALPALGEVQRAAGAYGEGARVLVAKGSSCARAVHSRTHASPIGVRWAARAARNKNGGGAGDGEDDAAAGAAAHVAV